MNSWGEVFSLIAALLLAYSTFSQKKSKMIFVQALNAIACCISDFLLGGYSAVVTNIFTFFRNILVVKNKFDKKYTIITCILMIVVGVIFNNREWIGLFSIIASVQYTICVYILKSAQQMRYALAINLLFWAFFDFAIDSYPLFIMDIAIIVITVINIIRYRNDVEEKKQMIANETIETQEW